MKHTVISTVVIWLRHLGYAAMALALLGLSASSRAAPFAYITNILDDTVSVIDTATHTVLDTVSVGDGPSAFGQFIGPLLVSVCDMQMSQTSYATGDTVTAGVFRLANPGVSAVAVEWKVWLTIPGLDPLSIVSMGAGGSLVLPPGFDHDVGPASLFSVSPAHPRGGYGFDCRLLDPVTGATVSLDENPFDLQ